MLRKCHLKLGIFSELVLFLHRKFLINISHAKSLVKKFKKASSYRGIFDNQYDYKPNINEICIKKSI